HVCILCEMTFRVVTDSCALFPVIVVSGIRSGSAPTPEAAGIARDVTEGIMLETLAVRASRSAAARAVEKVFGLRTGISFLRAADLVVSVSTREYMPFEYIADV